MPEDEIIIEPETPEAVAMTIEQEIQFALKASISAILTAKSIICAIHAMKLDSVVEEENEETYPVIVINTATPVPIGHKSSIIDVSAWITTMVFLPDDRQKATHTALADVVFRAIHLRDDWSTMMPEVSAVGIPAVTITGGEEPSIENGVILSQVTNCIVNASYIES